MAYALFLDDERLPPDKPDDRIWLVVRNREQFFAALAHYGPPAHVSFDHDLGSGQATGYNIAREWVDEMIVGHHAKPAPGFTYAVHSMNPVGAKAIENWMEDTRFAWDAK